MTHSVCVAVRANKLVYMHILDAQGLACAHVRRSVCTYEYTSARVVLDIRLQLPIHAYTLSVMHGIEHYHLMML